MPVPLVEPRTFEIAEALGLFAQSVGESLKFLPQGHGNGILSLGTANL